MRISDWSSDVCSSDLKARSRNSGGAQNVGGIGIMQRCGLVAVVGAPNAGKSTLVNALVGKKVAITSPKTQTTRTRLLGVALEGQAQIMQIGRAPCRERVCPYVEISVVDVSGQKKKE